MLEQPFGLQLGLQCLKRLTQCAVTGRFYTVDNQLIVAAPFIQADPTARAHLQAILHGDLQAGGMLAKQGAANLGAIVLQAEIKVPRGGARQIREFAFYPDTRENIFQQLSGAGVELADAEHVALGTKLFKQGIIIHASILVHSLLLGYAPSKFALKHHCN